MMDDDDDLGTRHRCRDCGLLSPKTETNYTLISARHGWRLTRRLDAAGRHVLDWRCAGCWQKFKRPR